MPCWRVPCAALPLGGSEAVHPVSVERGASAWNYFLVFFGWVERDEGDLGAYLKPDWRIFRKIPPFRVCVIRGDRAIA